MLSRVAESLYWIGRYVERAEDTSRLLDVHLPALLDGLQRILFEVGEAVSRRYFHHAGALAWSAEAALQ